MYRYPRDLPRVAGVVDVDKVNRTILRAGHQVGRVDGHNLNAVNVAANVPVGTGAYYKNYYSSTALDPQFGASGGGYTLPSNAVGTQLSNSGIWEVLDTQTVSTGLSVLWVNARVQYFWHPWVNTGAFGHQAYRYVGVPGAGERAYGAGVQFALRVDGQIIDGTLTGQANPRHRDYIPIKAVPQRSTASPLPGPQIPRGHRVAGVGPCMMPVRLFGYAFVPPGAHVVELLGTRIAHSFHAIGDINWLAADDIVLVTTRQFLVTDFPTWPASTAASGGLQVPAYEAEDVVSHASMYTGRMQTLQTRFNTLGEADVARGALGREHLPQTLLDWDEGSIVIPIATDVAQCDDFYPAWIGVGTIAGAKTGAEGWWPMEDGVGVAVGANRLETKQFDLTTTPNNMLLFANVHWNAVVDGTIAGMADPSIVAAFAIGAQTAGNEFIIEDSIGFVHNWNCYGRSAGFGGILVDTDASEDMDVALMAYIDNPNPALYDATTRFRVYTCAFDIVGGLPAERATVSWNRGSIQALQFRAG